MAILLNEAYTDVDGCVKQKWSSVIPTLYSTPSILPYVPQTIFRPCRQSKFTSDHLLNLLNTKPTETFCN